jgi:hypothetical protein
MTNARPFTLIAAIIFAMVALVHLYRLADGFEVIIGGRQLGVAASIAGLLIGGLLSVMLFRESRR